jgi:hypothetical protein
MARSSAYRVIAAYVRQTREPQHDRRDHHAADHREDGASRCVAQGQAIAARAVAKAEYDDGQGDDQPDHDPLDGDRPEARRRMTQLLDRRRQEDAREVDQQ